MQRADLADRWRAWDWSLTPLGPVENWSPSLKTAAALAFATEDPTMLVWGPDLLCLPNGPLRALRGYRLGLVAPPAEAWLEWWPLLERNVRDVLDGVAAITSAVQALPCEDTHRPFVLTCSPIYDPAAPSGVNGVLVLFRELSRGHDVASEARLDALVHLNRTLEQQVAQRTEALQRAEDALRQAQKMEALGHLTGGVAHDFNNLLGAMVGSFELIRRKHKDEARVQTLAEAGLLVAERGGKLTRQLLTFSRAQSIELTPVDVGAIVDGMREMLRRTLGPRITVDFELPSDSRFVSSDPTQLEMALLNLAINARDAMPDGGRLTVAAALRTIDSDDALAPGDYVELLVRDTGTGMSPEVAGRAFDPFFTTKSVGKGTGLGLSQVEGIARQASGAVRIESRPGGGTTIRMLLPCTDAPRRIERSYHVQPERQATTEATVLLVDDDSDLRSVLAASLQDLGYGVIEAPDGTGGLAMLERHQPDLLVADFAMPGMTGAELARSARLLRPNLPIILASGYAETIELPATPGPPPRLLRKPFRIRELQAEIKEVLATRA